jgi:hypothetical protein
MVIWGENYYGKVDRIPGVCHVRTRFLHFWFFPLVPTRSYLIQEFLSGGQAAGGPGNPSRSKTNLLQTAEVITRSEGFVVQVIRLSLKSVAFARTRALLVILLVGCWGAALEFVLEPHGAGLRLALAPAGAGLALCGLYGLTLPLSKPGKRRREFLFGLLSSRESGTASR